MTLAKVSTGQPFHMPAEAFNAFVDAAAAYQASRLSRSVDRGGPAASAAAVPLRNDTGVDLDRFAAVGIGGPLIAPSSNLAAFQERVALRGVIPDADTHRHRFAILQEPIAAGAIGRALVAGVSPVLLSVGSADDDLAGVATGATGALATGSDGGARILWKEASAGVCWGLVQVPAAAATAAPSTPSRYGWDGFPLSLFDFALKRQVMNRTLVTAGTYNLDTYLYNDFDTVFGALIGGGQGGSRTVTGMSGSCVIFALKKVRAGQQIRVTVGAGGAKGIATGGAGGLTRIESDLVTPGVFVTIAQACGGGQSIDNIQGGLLSFMPIPGREIILWRDVVFAPTVQTHTVSPHASVASGRPNVLNWRSPTPPQPIIGYPSAGMSQAYGMGGWASSYQMMGIAAYPQFTESWDDVVATDGKPGCCMLVYGAW